MQQPSVVWLDWSSEVTETVSKVMLNGRKSAFSFSSITVLLLEVFLGRQDVANIFHLFTSNGISNPMK